MNKAELYLMAQRFSSAYYNCLENNKEMEALRNLQSAIYYYSKLLELHRIEEKNESSN